jgi:hypothetical protein
MQQGRTAHALLGVDKPHPTPEQGYMFERPVTFSHGDGSSPPGRMDCYKRDHLDGIDTMTNTQCRIRLRRYHCI